MTHIPGSKQLQDLRAVQVATSPCATGQAHTLVLNTDGEVYCFGTSALGALGQGPDVRQTAPLLLRMTKTVPIRQIAAGARHSMLVADDGSVYSFGENRRGQLGLGAGVKFANEPTRVEGQLLNERARIVAVGDEHVVTCTESGNVYS